MDHTSIQNSVNTVERVLNMRLAYFEPNGVNIMTPAE